MSDSQNQERPSKRLKLAPHPQPAGLSQPGPPLRFIKPAPFPSVVAPPRSTINMPLSWVNVLSTTRPRRVRERVREHEHKPEPEPERELRRGRGRGGRRGRGRGRASTKSGTPQTEAVSLVNADLETISSPVPTESISSQISTLTATVMSPEYFPEASSELSFEISSEALSEAIHEPMQLDAAASIETVVVPQDISACKSTASDCYAIISSLKTACLHTYTSSWILVVYLA